MVANEAPGALQNGIIGQATTVSTSIAPRPNAVQAVIRSAWRRRLLMLIIEQLGFALSFVLPGAIVLLLLGTQILDWHWLFLLGAAAGVTAVVRVKRRVVSHYAVAQMVDERLQLRDSLSTAWFLLEDSAKHDADAALFQISEAEELARDVRTEEVFAFSGQRGWVVAGAMACVVLGLFAVRYLVTDGLNPRRALAPLHFSALGERVAELVLPTKASKRRTQSRGGQDAGTEAKDRNAMQPKEGMSPGGSDGPEENTTARSNAEDGRGAGGHSEPRDGAEQEHSSGFMDKMKDALSSLLSKLKASPAPSPDSGRPEAQGRPESGAQDMPDGQQNGQAKDGAGQSRGSQQQKAEAGSGAQEQPQTTESGSRVGADSDQGPRGKNSDSQSGAGRQDGDKTLSNAEQLKAMGRIAEIIGKRSASVSGEMTVEKSSGRQQLQTQYSNERGCHQDLGGEINHDEIPAEYRDYVREYMNEVHKQADAKH